MALTWLKKGEASQSLAKQEAAAQEKRREEYGKLWRFWIDKKEEGRLTFIDGDLGPDGFLIPPRFYEHNIYHNGEYGNLYVCPEKTNPESGDKCPLCEGGDRPSLMTAFTIIDHRKYKAKSGKEYSDTRKLFVCKPMQFELLNKIAVKRGGLAGATFDVSRIGEKSANVGDMFDFVEKNEIASLKAKFTRQIKDEKTGKVSTVCDFEPADYDSEIVYRSEEQLRGLGFGKAANVGMVYKANQGGNAPAAAYDNEL